MKLKIKTKTLREALSKLRAIPSNQLLSSKAVTLISDEMEGLCIHRNTGSIEARIEVEGAEVTKEGKASLDLGYLEMAVSKAAGETTEITADEKVVTVKIGKSKATIPVWLESEMIAVTELPEAKESMTITGPELERAISVASGALSATKGREEFMHVDLRPVCGQLSFVATDGRRMHMGAVDAASPVSVIIPKAVIPTIGKMFYGQEEVTISDNDTKFRFKSEGMDLQYGKIECKIPNVDAPVAEALKAKSWITLNREEFEKAVNACASFSSTDVIKIECAKGIANIIGGIGTLTQNRIEVAVKTNAPGTSFGVNASYLVDVLSVAKEDDITLKFSEEMHAITFQEKDATIVLMACRVQ